MEANRRWRSSLHTFCWIVYPTWKPARRVRKKRSAPAPEKLMGMGSPRSQRRGRANERTTTTRHERDSKEEQTTVGTREEWDWAEKPEACSDRAAPRSCGSGKRRLPGSQRRRDFSLGKCYINYSCVLELDVHHFDNLISSWALVINMF